MKLKAYAVLDIKLGAYNNPFFMENDSMAIRSFGDITNDERSVIYKHPEDYTLNKIGEYDTDSGELKAQKIEAMMNASNCVKPKNLMDEAHWKNVTRPPEKIKDKK